MGQRLMTQMCGRKHRFQHKREAEHVVERWRAMGKLRYDVSVYTCPFGAHYHIGRTGHRR